MRTLTVRGGDYAALSFEQHFKGEKVSDIIDDLEQKEKEFLDANPDYSNSLELKVKELFVSKEDYAYIADVIGDYDYMKTDNIYFEDEFF